MNRFINNLNETIPYCPEDKKQIDDLAIIALGLTLDDSYDMGSYWLLRHCKQDQDQGILVIKPKDKSGKLYSVNKKDGSVFLEEI